MGDMFSGLNSMKLTLSATLLAVILFVPLFITRGLGPIDFWWWLSANLVLLISIVFFMDRSWRQAIAQDMTANMLFKIGLGVLSALLLYVVFFVGNFISRNIFTFAGSGIQDVYAFKMGVSKLRIALLMIFIIGPGEELFWRGFLQRNLQNNAGN